MICIKAEMKLILQLERLANQFCGGSFTTTKNQLYISY